MKTHDEHLAWLLAAELHPHLKSDPAYAEAEGALRESEDLQAAFEEMRDFDRLHPFLIGFDRMPDDVRERLQTALSRQNAPAREAIPFESSPADPPKKAWDTQQTLGQLSPLSYRKQFAWAAVLALFLAMVSVLSSNLLEMNQPRRPVAQTPARQNFLDEFHQFVSLTANEGVALDHRAESTTEIISWLAEQQAQVPVLPEILREAAGNGCAVREGPRGKISIVCVNMQGQRMQLYIGCARALRSVPKSPEQIVLDGRSAIEWVDENNAYLLLGTDPDAHLPEMLL